MKILLTGSNGFIGSHLHEKLIEEGHEVHCLVKPNSRNPPLFMDRLNVPCDLTDYCSVMDAVEKVKPDTVIHLAALTPVRLSWIIPVEYQKTNYLGTVNLVESLLKMGKQFKLVFASTAEVFGDTVDRNGVKESVPLQPISPYAASKVACEQYLQMRKWRAKNELAFDLRILRCNNTFGRPRSGYFVESVMEQMIPRPPDVRGRKIVVKLYNPNHVRDYLWYEDHVDAYLHVMDLELNDFEKHCYNVFNVAYGEPVSNIYMAKLVADTLKIDAVFMEKQSEFPRPRDQELIVQDCGRIRGTGWSPKVSRVDAIKKLAHMEERYGFD